MAQVVLVSNGPGELYTWVKPVLEELRRSAPDTRVSISLVPCQFAGGNEAAIAETFEPDALTTPSQYLRAAASGAAPRDLKEASAGRGAVIGLGGNAALTVALGKRLGFPSFRYSFEPHWQQGLDLLMVPDQQVLTRAVRRGAPKSDVRVVGNLVADAVQAAERVPDAGDPHVLLFAGSRDSFAVHLIPFMIALVDRLGVDLPGARFVWPVSRLLRPETVSDGVAGRWAATLGGAAGTLEGGVVITPGGHRLELSDEDQRYAHMRSADLAITIPGTNTLELGVAGVPAIVLLPMNRPELIPLEGAGHWLGLVPLVGRYLKRYAVKLFVEGLSVPVSLPNKMAGEDLMVEITGRIDPVGVAERAAALLADESDLRRRRERLLATMPGPGAAARLVSIVTEHAGLERG
ncbi:MAG TPA: hypothetical protein VFN03_04725 [Trueperaceae bacterium]|nr:hypothetical protein [Trueperaceae bacterium]